MLNTLNQWIDKTNLEYQSSRTACTKFANEFKGFYSSDFLQNAYFVVVNTILKPDLPELRAMGLGNFIDLEVHGITYKNTYYILPHLASDLRLHFHELVHVAQWIHLGPLSFIERYITEIQTHGYSNAPLEKMAYGLDAHFSGGGSTIDVPLFVSQNT